MLKKSGFQQVIIRFTFLLTLFLLTPLLSVAGGYVELPRSFGILKMGMSEKSFFQLTGIHPESCPICIKKETFVTLTMEQLSDLDMDGDGADVFFYDNKLYLLSMGTTAKDLFIINEDFETLFGGPGKKVNTDNNNGISRLKWEDSNTLVTLNYFEKQKKVFSVNYYDWDIKQERDWRESQALEAIVGNK